MIVSILVPSKIQVFLYDVDCTNLKYNIHVNISMVFIILVLVFSGIKVVFILNNGI